VRDGQFSVQLKKEFPVRHLKILIGTKDYAEEHSDGIPLIPFEYSLQQNYPNPFNPETTIRYQLKQRGAVALEIYNMLGQKVRTLVNAEQNTGEHFVKWDGLNHAGRSVASGVYVYRLIAGEFRASRKLLLIR